MVIKVHPRLPLPHKVFVDGRFHDFTPACEVPDEWGKAALKDKNSYLPLTDEEAETFKKDGAISTDGYTLRDVLRGKGIEEIFNHLPTEPRTVSVGETEYSFENPKMQIFDLMSELNKPLKAKPTNAPEKPLAEKTVEELFAYAKEHSIAIPEGTTHRDDVLLHIIQNQKD